MEKPFSGSFLTESLNFLKSTYFLSFLSSSERSIGLSAVEKIITTRLSSSKVILRTSSIWLVDLVSLGRVETLKILLSIKTNARLERERSKGLSTIETRNRNSLRRNFRFHLAAWFTVFHRQIVRETGWQCDFQEKRNVTWGSLSEIELETRKANSQPRD